MTSEHVWAKHGSVDLPESAFGVIDGPTEDEAIKNGYFKIKVNFTLYFIRYRVMKAYEEVVVKLHAFVYPALARD